MRDLSAIKKSVSRMLDLFKASYVVTCDNIHEVCEEYQPYWTDVSELWLLGNQGKVQGRLLIVIVIIIFISFW